MDLTTAGIEQCVDHILLPQAMANGKEVRSSVFVEKGLSDHTGIMVNINAGASPAQDPDGISA